MPRKYTLEEFRIAVAESTSKREVLRKLGLAEAGGNYASFDRLVHELKLDTSHLLGQAHLRGKTHNWSKPQNLNEILISGSYIQTSRLRCRLIKEKILDNKCYECGLTEWKGKPLSLELEHKNGIRSDNRIENLTILCPNCHSQTNTYRGKNKKVRTLTPITLAKAIETERCCTRCINCEVKILKNSLRCRSCATSFRKHNYVIDWPSDEKLIELLKNNSYLSLAKILGVSDNAIRKRLRRRRLTLLPVSG